MQRSVGCGGVATILVVAPSKVHVTPWHVIPMDSLADRLAATLDDYLIEREIKGGMSRVFVAADRVLSRRVVIKVLDPALAAGVSADRFRREILTAAALQHPHIVGVLSTGEVDGLPFFVMPYVDGASLADTLRANGPLPSRTVITILRDVARALAFAHDRGVIHRDIKPGNILLTGGSAVVTDFGVAKALSSSQRSGESRNAHSVLTTAGTSLGTLLYMAPEQAAADPAVDGRADMYSLGVTAYEALTGAPPFAELSARAMLTARLSGAVPPLRRRCPDVPPALEALVLRCLASDPADRPQHAQELVDALESSDMGIATRVSGALPAARPARHRARVVAITAAAAACALGGIALPVVLSFTRATAPAPGATAELAPTASVAVVPFVDLGEDSSGASFATGLTNAVAGSLTKTGRVRVLSPSVAGQVARAARSGLHRRAGAPMLLEGTVQRDGSRVRVTARLTSTVDGVMQWADVYDRDASDLLAVEDEIAAAIVSSVTPASGRVASTVTYAAPRG